MIRQKLAGKSILDRFQELCADVSSPYSLAVLSDIRQFGALRALKRVPPQPRDYSSATAFGNDWMVYNYLRKYPKLPGSKLKDRQQAAIDGWKAAEKKCLSTNRRFDAFERGYALPLVSDEEGVTAAQVLCLAQLKIARVLGPYNEKKVFDECRWSNGATCDHKRGTHRSNKMTKLISVTPRALPYLRKVLQRDIHWTASILGVEPVGYASLLDSCFHVIDENRHAMVPKTAYIERSIGIEPTGNAFLQQGVGRFLRRRLKRVGIDLDDQSLSQRRAAEAVDLGLSTLDLESASDTVSRKLVRFLLPWRWYRLLDSLRTPITRLANGEAHLLEKFSSMGNAFTFELESLLFWALSSASAELTTVPERASFVTVYGDDIIAPRESAEKIVSILSLCGFSLNEGKSFIDGQFFESCGKHYFSGVDVTPMIQDSVVLTTGDEIRYFNRVIRWNVRTSGFLFRKETRALLKGIHTEKLHQLFCVEGDDAFIVPLSEFKARYCANRGYLINAIVEISRYDDDVNEAAAYAYKLRRSSSQNETREGYCRRARDPSTIRVTVWRSGDLYEPIDS